MQGDAVLYANFKVAATMRAQQFAEALEQTEDLFESIQSQIIAENSKSALFRLKNIIQGYKFKKMYLSNLKQT